MATSSHIVVTGGAGFIGSHVVDALLMQGHRVTVIDNFSTGKEQNIAHHAGVKDFFLSKADITKPIDTHLSMATEHLGPVDGIVHLAAQVSVPVSIQNPSLDMRTNLGGTLQLLEYARHYGVRTFVFASSAAVYGEQQNLPIEEAAPLKPMSPYGIHKRCVEYHLDYYAHTYALRCVPLRFFNVYGPRQDPNNPYSGVISIFFDRAFQQQPITIFGDGLQSRDFIEVSDITRGIMAALFGSAQNDASPNDSSALPMNLGTGTSTSILKLAQTIIQLTDSSSTIVYADERDGDITHSSANIHSAQTRLGFSPNTPLTEGLQRLRAWIETQETNRPAHPQQRSA